jgi:predicted GH43/DUF377 family glycosyl hydrolase
MFDSEGVESGPPPLQLSDGNWVFFYNAWNTTGKPRVRVASTPLSLSLCVVYGRDAGVPDYHPAWLVLDGKNPGNILQRATAPVLYPTLPWEEGVPPELCNVARVVFLEAARPLGNDRFEVYFGGADTTVGRAVIAVSV